MNTERNWIVENTWICTHCQFKNLGRFIKCQNCGNAKNPEESDIINPNSSPVTDPNLLNLASQGEHWACEFCNGQARDSFGKCQNCGGKRINPNDYNTKPEPTPIPVGNPSLNQPNELLFIGSFLSGLTIFIGLLVLLTRPFTVEFKDATWVSNVEIQALVPVAHSGWGHPANAFETVCVNKFKENIKCHPHDCNPHPENYTCNPHFCNYTVNVDYNCNPYDCSYTTTESYSCGSHSCNCRTSCVNLKNGFSSCKESCSTCSDTCTRLVKRSKTCYRTCNRNEVRSRPCFDTCTRTAYDTCYDTCAVNDDYCNYKTDDWVLESNRGLSGSGLNVALASTEDIQPSPRIKFVNTFTLSSRFVRGDNIYNHQTNDPQLVKQLIEHKTWNATRGFGNSITLKEFIK